MEFFKFTPSAVWDAAGHHFSGVPAHQEVFLDAAAT